MKQFGTPWIALVPALILTVLICSSPAGAVSSGGLILSKASLNFGNVVLGSASQVVESISNPTPKSITIAAASTDGDYHIIGTGFPLTVTPGQRVSVILAFSPSVAGSSSGSFTLSLDGTTPYLTVPLFGVAVNAGGLSPSLSAINFAPGGGSQRISETISNSGSTNVMLAAATSSGNGFAFSGPALPLMLGPNQSAVFTVYPTSSTGVATGAINFTGEIRWWTPGERGAYQYSTITPQKTVLSIPVTGASVVAGQLAVAPSSLNFGSTPVSSTHSLPATLTNSGVGPVTVTQASASGAGFSLSGLPLPMTLTPGESATFSATFLPTTAGSAQGSISFASNASDPNMSVGLTGTALAPGQLTLSPASLNFGNVTVGKTQQLSATLTASGSSVTVSSASVSSSEYILSGIQLPLTIPAGQSTTFVMTFSPQSSGSAAATVAFGGTGSPATEALSGTGSAVPVQHNVSLSWSAGSSSVTGYNVYRGAQSGGPYSKLNSSALPATTFGDGSVSSGQTYYYVTTALDSGGGESAHSNEVSAAIPSP